MEWKQTWVFPKSSVSSFLPNPGDLLDTLLRTWFIFVVFFVLLYSVLLSFGKSLSLVLGSVMLFVFFFWIMCVLTLFGSNSFMFLCFVCDGSLFICLAQ